MSEEMIRLKRAGRIVPVLSIIGLSIVLRFSIASAQTGAWSEPVSISNTSNTSWFPDLTVDSQGDVHVIWCETTDFGGRRGPLEQVSYSEWHGGSWADPNDIVPPSRDIIRNAIALDRRDVIHMLFGGSSYDSVLTLYYQSAHSDEAWSAAAWSRPHRVSPSGSYMGDIAVDSQGVIHAVFDNVVRMEGAAYRETENLSAADIFYRRSVDDGRTWTPRVNLFPSASAGSSRPQMEIDSSDTIHVTWDEGWDRLTGWGAPVYSAYTFSSDGGSTWAPAITVTYPVSGVAQLAVGSDGDGGVMLVWRTVSRDEIFYQWSGEGGRSWEAPSRVPGVLARPWANPFDMYDMATDSAGHIHLVVVGRQFLDRQAPLGVYHLEWDGEAWSPVERIYGGAGFPEYPKIAVSQGNQLHVVWFVREMLGYSADQDSGPHQVWYSSSQSTAPHQVVTPLPTATPMPPTPTPRPAPTATVYPTVSFDHTGLPDGLYTESDEVFQLTIALSPVALLVLTVIAVRRGRFGKLRR